MYFGFSWLPTYFNYEFGMSTAQASTPPDPSTCPRTTSSTSTSTPSSSTANSSSRAGLVRLPPPLCRRRRRLAQRRRAVRRPQRRLWPQPDARAQDAPVDRLRCAAPRLKLSEPRRLWSPTAPEPLLVATHPRVRASLSLGTAGPAVAMLTLAALELDLLPGVSLTREAAEALFVIAVRPPSAAPPPAALPAAASSSSGPFPHLASPPFPSMQVGLASCSAAGFGCGAQDIATRFSSLIYGASSVFAVVAGASAQYFTGVLLEANGRDFSPIFLLTGGIELLGVVAFCSWWSSERAFE